MHLNGAYGLECMISIFQSEFWSYMLGDVHAVLGQHLILKQKTMRCFGATPYSEAENYEMLDFLCRGERLNKPT